MKEQVLFYTNGGQITNKDFVAALRSIKADESDILYIHTGLNFGVPNRELKKQQLLECLYESIATMDVPTLIFPTYTFSFCNGVDYSVQNSKSPMGLLNEYVRTKDDAIRSLDPLMSNVLVGKHREFVTDIGKSSVGIGSTFDMLHKTNLTVKFLFLGPKVGDCFTHMHYIEAEQQVPYRYYRNFTGKISNGNEVYEDSYELFVRYNNVFPGGGSYIYENLMIERGICQRKALGNGMISIIAEKPAYECYVELLRLSPSFYITEPFDEANNTTSFNVTNMVAL
jgi:aminoglycoside 3-N-acetyltransferase